MKSFLLLLIRILFFPIWLVYLFSDNKSIIDEDLKVMNRHMNIHYSMSASLFYHLLKNRYYRCIFYNRIGNYSTFFEFIFPKDRYLIVCDKIGAGVYPAHPYATILNAKSIGQYFSFRQCTTIGNKHDGDNEAIPVIGDNVTLGANVCIIGGITIGNNVVIGAGSVVVDSLPDNVVAVGNPARIIKRINKINESISI